MSAIPVPQRHTLIIHKHACEFQFLSDGVGFNLEGPAYWISHAIDGVAGAMTDSHETNQPGLQDALRLLASLSLAMQEKLAEVSHG